MRINYFMPGKLKKNCLLRCNFLLNKPKNSAKNMLFVSSQMKQTLTNIKKINQRNDKELCADSSEVPRIMHTKFPTFFMFQRLSLKTVGCPYSYTSTPNFLW